LRPKIGQLLFGQLVWRKIFFFQFFLLAKYTTYFTSFTGTPSTSNSDSYEPMVKFCSKQVLSSFFLYFLRSSYMQPCGWNCPRAVGQGAKKEVCFAHRILVFHFFHFFFLLMVLHDVTFNMTATIWMWSFWFVLKVHSVEVLSQDPHEQKEF
jgi:hypothetical protein